MPSLDDVKELLATHQIDIMCVSETWLTPDISDSYLTFSGYSVIRSDRKRPKRGPLRKGGGVCILYRDSLAIDLTCERRKSNDLRSSRLALTWRVCGSVSRAADRS